MADADMETGCESEPSRSQEGRDGGAGLAERRRGGEEVGGREEGRESRGEKGEGGSNKGWNWVDACTCCSNKMIKCYLGA